MTKFRTRRGVRLGLLLLVGSLLVACLPATRHGYHQLRARLYNERATHLLAQQRTSEAALMVRNSLRHAPDSAATWRLHAAVLKQWQSPQYPAALARAWMFDTNNVPLVVEALTAALNGRDRDTATFLLARAAPAFPAQADVQHLAGLLFSLQGREAEAARHLETAAALAPTNLTFQLSLATLRAWSTVPSERERATAQLTALARNPTTRQPALTALAALTSARDPARALELWDTLLAADPDAFPLQLQRLATLHQLRPADVPRELATLFARTTNTADLIPLATAALAFQQPTLADRAVSRIARDDQWLPEVSEVRWEAYARTAQWRRLLADIADREAAVSRPEDQARFALWQYRAQSALGNATLCPSLIARLGTLLADQPDIALMFGRQLLQWRLPDAASVLLDIATRGNPLCRYGAWSDLLRIAKQQRNNVQALRAAEALLTLQPDDPAALSQVAFHLALARTELTRATNLIAAATRALPHDPQRNATRARLLFLDGNITAALDIYSTLPPDTLALPTVSVHHAEALDRAGQPDAARTRLAGIRSDQLFPGDAATLTRLQQPH